MDNLIDSEYKNWLYDLKKRYKLSQIKAAVTIGVVTAYVLFVEFVGKHLSNNNGNTEYVTFSVPTACVNAR